MKFQLGILASITQYNLCTCSKIINSRSIPQTKCIWDLCIQATERAELNTNRDVDMKGMQILRILICYLLLSCFTSLYSKRCKIFLVSISHEQFIQNKNISNTDYMLSKRNH